MGSEAPAGAERKAVGKAKWNPLSSKDERGVTEGSTRPVAEAEENTSGAAREIEELEVGAQVVIETAPTGGANAGVAQEEGDEQHAEEEAAGVAPAGWLHPPVPHFADAHAPRGALAADVEDAGLLACSVST